MAKEYQGSSTGGAFSPNKTLRTGDNSKENENRYASTLSDYGQIQGQNDSTQVENAKKQGRNIEQLSKFSNKLTEKLVKDQQARNLEDYESGIADAYLNGIPEGEAVEFDKQEAAVNAVGQETDALGAEYYELSGSRSQGEQISASSGWRALGRATGSAKQGAAQYPLYIAMNAEKLASASTPQEYAATLAELRKEYTGKFSGMNRAMMGKYMFPKMQEFEATQFLNWQQKNNEMIMNDRVDDMGNDFYTEVNNGKGGEGFLAFIEKNKHFLGGRGNARKKLFEVLKKGIANNTITRDKLVELQATPFPGENTTLGRKYAKEFDALDDLHHANDAQTYNQEQAQIKIKSNEIIKEIRQYQASLGRKMTNEEQQRVLNEWPVELGPPPGELKDMITLEDVEETALEDRLKAKIASNATITEQDLIGISAQARQTYRGFVSPAVAENRSEGKTIVQGYVTNSIVGETGKRDKSPAWHDTNLNAQREFNRAYTKYIRGGASADQALNSALQDVSTGLKNKTINNKLDTSSASETYKSVNDSMKMLDADPDSYKTTTLPGSTDSLEQLEQEIKTSTATGKTITVPQFYHTVASSLKGVSGWDLANQQSLMNGGAGLQKPQAEQLIDGLPDATIKEWMTYKPTPSRTMRTIEATGDAASFLNFVSGPESGGDYNAFNLGGKKGGHQAIGSAFGDSATKRWGKQLTQMTVGEVMELGSSPSSENRWVWAAGRYQIIPDTLSGLVRNHGIDTNALYDEAMQDQMALYLAYARLVAGNKITGLRNEWLGLHNYSAGEIQASLGQAYNNPQLLLKGV